LGADFPERQPTLNTPDPSYHGAIWTEAVKPLGPIAYIIKARVTPAARSRQRAGAVQLIPDAAGHRNAGAADGTSLRQHLGGSGMAFEAAGGRQGDSPRRRKPAPRASAPRNI